MKHRKEMNVRFPQTLAVCYTVASHLFWEFNVMKNCVDMGAFFVTNFSQAIKKKYRNHWPYHDKLIKYVFTKLNCNKDG